MTPTGSHTCSTRAIRFTWPSCSQRTGYSSSSTVFARSLQDHAWAHWRPDASNECKIFGVATSHLWRTSWVRNSFKLLQTPRNLFTLWASAGAGKSYLFGAILTLWLRWVETAFDRPDDPPIAVVATSRAQHREDLRRNITKFLPGDQVFIMESMVDMDVEDMESEFFLAGSQFWRSEANREKSLEVFERVRCQDWWRPPWRFGMAPMGGGAHGAVVGEDPMVARWHSAWVFAEQAACVGLDLRQVAENPCRCFVLVSAKAPRATYPRRVSKLNFFGLCLAPCAFWPGHHHRRRPTAGAEKKFRAIHASSSSRSPGSGSNCFRRGADHPMAGAEILCGQHANLLPLGARGAGIDQWNLPTALCKQLSDCR